MSASKAEAERFAERMKALLDETPEGWGLFCMDAEMLLVPPRIFEEAKKSDITQTEAPFSELISCGSINGDCGGW